MLWYRYKGDDVHGGNHTGRSLGRCTDRRQKLDSKGDEWKGTGIACATTSLPHVEFTPRDDFALERSSARTAGSAGELALGQAAGDTGSKGPVDVFVSAATDQRGKAGRETAQLLNWVIRHDNLLERPADLAGGVWFCGIPKAASILKEHPGCLVGTDTARWQWRG